MLLDLAILLQILQHPPLPPPHFYVYFNFLFYVFIFYLNFSSFTGRGLRVVEVCEDVQKTMAL